MKNNILEALQSYTGVRQIISLNGKLPNGLFYYAEGLENGNEDKLENKELKIEFTGEDERESFVLNITINEDANLNEIFFLDVEAEPQNNIDIKLPYQQARKLLVDMIINGEPYSVNLITK